MKHISFALVLLSSIVLSIAIIFASGHKTSRENEVENALDIAIESALENVMYDKTYTIDNTEEFMADFLEDLMLQMDSDSNVHVVCKAIDMEKGLLSIEVTASFLYNNGNQGQVTVERTVVFESAKNTASTTTQATEEYCVIEYYAIGDNGYELYKTLTVKKGSKITNISTPSIADKKFYKWVTERGIVINTNTYKVNTDLQIYAIYKKAG